MRWLVSGVLVVAGCGDQVEPASSPDASPRGDGAIGDVALDTTDGATATSACSASATQPSSACLADAAAAVAWGGCSLPDGIAPIALGSPAPLPAAYVSLTGGSQCAVLAFAATSCGTVAVTFGLDIDDGQREWMTLADMECWQAEHGSVCARVIADSTLALHHYCSGGALYQCSGYGELSIEVTTTTVIVGSADGHVSGCGPSGGMPCQCW